MTSNYVTYRILTREQAFARGFDGKWINAGAKGGCDHYDYARARQLLTRYPDAREVHFCRRSHNDCTSRYTPQPGVVIYVKASGGRWGKSAYERVGQCQPAQR